MNLSDAIDKGLATLGWNAQPEGWYWIDYGTLCAWVDPEAVDLIEGREKSMSELHGDEGQVEPTERDRELALEEIVDDVMNYGCYPRKGRAAISLYDFVSEHRDPVYCLEMYVGALIDDAAYGQRDRVERERGNIRDLLSKHLKDSDMVDDLATEISRENEN